MSEPADVTREAARRRTIAVISHPDAGKSTLTEALLLHAQAIGTAGAVHGKRGRSTTVSDFMQIEQERGISISSAAIQFAYRDTIINLVDTPGHSDFSEDTYRVLSAVDAAIMLVDAAKGLEAQTMKLFEVCSRWNVPIITMINKWDRPGRAALDLVDEIRDRTGLLPSPITWPVGEAGYFEGLLDVEQGVMQQFERAVGGATISQWHEVSAEQAQQQHPEAWSTARDEVDLLALDGHVHDRERFRSRASTPLVFGSAVHNIGIHTLLDLIAGEAPGAVERRSVTDAPRAIDDDFSGYVFKVQAGLDSAHRDRIAFIRVCSGRFERGMTVTNARTGRSSATKYAHQLFGDERSTVDEAWPGDVVGLVNAAMVRPGDTIYAGSAVEFPALPRFVPEHFSMARTADLSKYKQFRKGVESLEQEGVLQVLRSERRGEQHPVLGAVGPLQFEVFAQRMELEYGCAVKLEPMNFDTVCVTDEASVAGLNRQHDCEIVRRSDGVVLALFSNQWRARVVANNNPDLTLLTPTGERVGTTPQAASA